MEKRGSPERKIGKTRGKKSNGTESRNEQQGYHAGAGS